MEFTFDERSRELEAQVRTFFDDRILPRHREWTAWIREHGSAPPPLLEELRDEARAQGLWNLALPGLGPDDPGTRLSNLGFAPLGEIMGRLDWASQVFNCHAPDVPNMEILLRHASGNQRQRFLLPLLEGGIRSAFAMTEPAVASSDASQIACRIRRDGDEYVIDGHKWFATAAAHPDCAFTIVVGQTDHGGSRTGRHTLVIVPNDTPGFEIRRRIGVMGHVDEIAPHTEIRLNGVRVPVENRLGGEGEGFRVAQDRLGPARVHHCMRAIGDCEVLIELMTARARERHAFGRALAEYDTIQSWIALSRLEIEQARLMVHKTAWLLDEGGYRAARREVSIIKIAVARAYQAIADRAMQVFGALGTTGDTPIAASFARARAFRIYDGPDEVHFRSIWRLEPESEGSLAASPYLTPFE